MVVAYILVGMIAGAILAVMGLIAGSSLWSAFLLYAVGGWLTTLGLAGLVYILPRKSTVPDHNVGSVAPEKIEV